MKAMKANPTFAQRELKSSQHSVESTPVQIQREQPSVVNVPIQTHHARQRSLPDSMSLASLNRRASESDALVKTRKNVVGELDRYLINHDSNQEFQYLIPHFV